MRFRNLNMPCLYMLLVISGISTSGLIANEAPEVRPWSQKLTATVYPGGAIGKYFHVVSFDGVLWALDPATGEMKWHYRSGSRVDVTPVVLDDNTIIFCDHDGQVHAVSADGQLKWRFKTGGRISASPALSRSQDVYVVSRDNHLYAINGKSGKLKWRLNMGGLLVATPVIKAGFIFLGVFEGKIVAIDLASQEIVWSRRVKGNVSGAPALYKHMIIFGTHGGLVYALNVESGDSLWEFKTGEVVASTPVIDVKGNVYVTAKNSCIYQLDAAKGRLSWYRYYDAEHLSSVAIGDEGTMYFSSNKQIYGIKPGGSKPWTLATPHRATAPLIYRGHLFYGTKDGAVKAQHCPSQSLQNSAWPIFGGSLRRNNRVR